LSPRPFLPLQQIASLPPALNEEAKKTLSVLPGIHC